MIAAERLLFASALEDLSNQRFVLLSDRSASLRIINHLMLSFAGLHSLVYSLYCILHTISRHYMVSQLQYLLVLALNC